MPNPNREHARGHGGRRAVVPCQDLRTIGDCRGCKLCKQESQARGLRPRRGSRPIHPSTDDPRSPAGAPCVADTHLSRPVHGATCRAIRPPPPCRVRRALVDRRSVQAGHASFSLLPSCRFLSTATLPLSPLLVLLRAHFERRRAFISPGDQDVSTVALADAVRVP